MEQRLLVNWQIVRVNALDEYDWHLSGDIIPIDVCGNKGTIIPVRSIQGLQISVDSLLPMVQVQLRDSLTFMIHQDNLERIDQ